MPTTTTSATSFFMSDEAKAKRQRMVTFVAVTRLFHREAVEQAIDSLSIDPDKKYGPAPTLMTTEQFEQFLNKLRETSADRVDLGLKYAEAAIETVEQEMGRSFKCDKPTPD